MIKKINRRIRKDVEIIKDYSILPKWGKQINTNIDSNKPRLILFAVISHFWVMDMVFYAINLRNMGYPITLVINKSLFTHNPIPLHYFNSLKKNIELKFFYADENNASAILENDDAKNSATNNVLYKLKNETYNPIDPFQLKLYNYFLNQYQNTLNFCSFETPKDLKTMFICPSGFIYESAAIYNYAKHNNIDIKTIETYGFETAKRIIGYGQLAVKDFSKFDINEYNLEIEKYIQSYISLQEKPIIRQEVKTGYLAYQKSDTGFSDLNLNNILNNGNKNILIATTVTGDSSTIGVDSPFKVQSNWIKSLLLHFKNSNVNLIIRIHPVEDLVKPQFNMAIFIKELQNQNTINNLFLIEANNKLNTFSILQKIDVVLTWVSTISADFALRKKMVIIAAKAPFYNLGFALYFDDIKLYFTKIHTILNRKSQNTVKDREIASSYLYFLFKKRVYTISNNNGTGTYREYTLTQNRELKKLLGNLINII